LFGFLSTSYFSRAACLSCLLWQRGQGNHSGPLLDCASTIGENSSASSDIKIFRIDTIPLIPEASGLNP
jgi:hypothetical protein